MTKAVKKGWRKGIAKRDREPLPGERAHIDAARARVADLPNRVEPIIAIEDGVCSIDAPHSDKAGQAVAFMDTLASGSNAFVNRQLANLASMGVGGAAMATSDDIGSGLAIVAAVEPRNELEAALAVQIAMTHQLAASLTWRAQQSPTIKGMTEYGNLATKAARTFTAQLEALTKLRSGGKQVVEHRHYNIDNRGGQTVVAENMMTGVPANERNSANQSHALGATLPGKDAEGFSVPSPADPRAAPVSNARG